MEMTEYPTMICKTGHINEINTYDRRPIISQKVTGVFILQWQTIYVNRNYDTSENQQIINFYVHASQ